MQKCVSDYLDAVCAGIRRGELRQAARLELASHIQERCGDLTAGGWDAEAAAREAVARMGDARELGKKIAAANRPGALLTLSGGVLLFLLGLGFTIRLGGGAVASFYDMGSFLGIALLSSAYGLLSCGGKPTLSKFLRGFKSGALYSGVLMAVTGCVIMLSNLSDPAALGPGLAVALLSVFYGILFSAAARTAESWTAVPEAGAIRSLLN